MNVKYRIIQVVLIVGDLIVLYASLLAALWVRQKFELNYELVVADHVTPFTILFALWLPVFYMFSLYDPRTLKNNLRFLRLFGWATIINIFTSLIFFYLLPLWDVAPKTNLVLFLLIFMILYFLWRNAYNRALGTHLPETKILLVGSGNDMEELDKFIGRNSQMGYRIVQWEKEFSQISSLDKIIAEKKIDILAMPHAHKYDPAITRAIIENLVHGINVLDSAQLYETMFRRVSISSVSDTWFIDNLAHGQKRFFDTMIRVFDVVLSAVLVLVLVPAYIIVAPLIALSSPGPIIYKQRRVGKNGKEFTLYKFRSMDADAEKSGPQWSHENDSRVTPLGKFLRASHIDELPQIINILRGDISLVGPRPERPEFVRDLKEKIPYYNTRHLIRPGMTGWAQINYRYGSSTEDAYRKLQYDMYYLKNRSVALYLVTVFKTLRVFAGNPK